MDNASVPDSRRASWRSSGKRLTAATTRMIPVIATTTRISTSVKPTTPMRRRPRVRALPRLSAGRGGPHHLSPRLPMSAALPSPPRARSAPEAEYVDLALHARREVLVVGAPRVLRKVIEIRLPVGGTGLVVGFCTTHRGPGPWWDKCRCRGDRASAPARWHPRPALAATRLASSGRSMMRGTTIAGGCPGSPPPRVQNHGISSSHQRIELEDGKQDRQHDHKHDAAHE